MGLLSKLTGLMSPSRTLIRVAKGKSITDTGPLTFKNSIDEGNVMGMNPTKPAADMSAAEMEAARQARISGNVADINKAYAGRGAQYDQYLTAVRKQLGDQLTRQQTDTSRNLKFGLARNGLTGGSAAVDSGKTLADEFSRGAIGVESKAQGAKASLQAADEASRNSLIGLAQAGGDIGDAAGQTASLLNANIGTARASDAANTLGDVFGGTAATYKSMQEAANLRRGLKDSAVYANPFTRGAGATGSSTGGF